MNILVKESDKMINLYPHQKEALELIKGKQNSAIYYDMGLG